MSGFERLSGALKYQIANALGFRSLRPVQELTIDAVLEGQNCVVLAPTAGGKTEAAFFPLISAMDEANWQPVSVLYLSPIRALLNNQEDRIHKYAGLVGRRAFKWHGDVPASKRKRFMGDPADILLTTPESLEAMLMSPRVPAGALFRGLQAVVIDEVHAFADDDRGAHLAAVLERLQRFCRRDIQRIGLSATVGNPDEIVRWVGGSSQRCSSVVNPGGNRAKADIKLDYVATIENAARVICDLHPGKKRLVFVDSRRGAEQLGKLLNQAGVMTFVNHGSLSVSERRDAERAFQELEDCVIVATSALELGIDVGNLDHVLQIDSPDSVASFLQRMGRTGRRPDTVPNCTFLATKDAAVLQAAALIRLYRQGFVEPVRPSRRASHILAHQVMALAIQLHGVPRGDWWAWVDGSTSFADLSADERDDIIGHMLANDILADHDGKLWLGTEGEKKYGRANFRALYAVFDAPRVITVRWNTREIGAVDAQFLATLDSDAQPGSFILAGKAWEIVHIEWERGICAVRPAPEGRAARWAGRPRFLSYELCQSMREILLSDEVDPSWSGRAQRVLATTRAEHAFLQDEPAPMLHGSEEITWYTFAGGAANELLARILTAELGGDRTVRNQSLTLKGEAAKSEVAVRQVLEQLGVQARPTVADACAHALTERQSRISKFQPCLPEGLLRELLASALLDAVGARRVVEAMGDG